MGFFLCVLTTLGLELFFLSLLQRFSPVRMCLKQALAAPSLRNQEDEHLRLEKEGGFKLFVITFK